jgi:hypothetical protein
MTDWRINVAAICNLICLFCWIMAQSMSATPPYWITCVFWCFVLTSIVLSFEWTKCFLLAGAVMNCATMLANGGAMPVLGLIKASHSVWRPALATDHLLFFADRFAGFSIGDFLIFTSMVVGIYMRRKGRVKVAAAA